MTDPIDIPAARALCEAATPGPWAQDRSLVLRGNGDEIACCEDDDGAARHANAAFIAAARALVPRLLDELEAARAASRTVRDRTAEDDAVLAAAGAWAAEARTAPTRETRTRALVRAVDARRAKLAEAKP